MRALSSELTEEKLHAETHDIFIFFPKGQFIHLSFSSTRVNGRDCRRKGALAVSEQSLRIHPTRGAPVHGKIHELNGVSWRAKGDKARLEVLSGLVVQLV